MADYEEGYLAAQNAHGNRHSAKATGVLVGLSALVVVRLVPLALRLLMETIVSVPFILLALAVTYPLDFLGSRVSEGRLLSIAAVTYAGLALLYGLKGVAIALRLRGGRLWLLPFAVCLSVGCLVPAVLLHLLILYAVPTTSVLVAWLVPVGFALFTYNRYRFTQDYAPTFTLWAYRLGYRSASK